MRALWVSVSDLLAVAVTVWCQQQPSLFCVCIRSRQTCDHTAIGEQQDVWLVSAVACCIGNAGVLYCQVSQACTAVYKFQQQQSLQASPGVLTR
jgi:hypothetical protein